MQEYLEKLKAWDRFFYVLQTYKECGCKVCKKDLKESIKLLDCDEIAKISEVYKKAYWDSRKLVEFIEVIDGIE